MSTEDAWNAVAVSKSRGLLDGSNMYRRVTIRHDDGREEKIRVPREEWERIEVGERVVKEAGQEPRRG